MFRIKICGITNVDDALAVAQAGADAVGLNFYRKSPRYVDFDQAKRIIDALPADVVKVVLFVNPEAVDVILALELFGFDLVQLHGDELPELLAEIGDRPVMRAFRLGRAGLRPVTEYLQRCRRLGCLPRMTLIDSRVTGEYGGTGTIGDWTVLGKYPTEEGCPPLVLAGGLTADNVAEAIRTVRPAAVDTASGVESSPGRKDPKAVEAFVRAARQAFDDR